jgi:hypothetical protein
MPEHFVVLRHQEGDDWDYVVIQHLGSKAEVTATAPPPSDAVRALAAWHSHPLQLLAGCCNRTRRRGVRWRCGWRLGRYPGAFRVSS